MAKVMDPLNPDPQLWLKPISSLFLEKFSGGSLPFFLSMAEWSLAIKLNLVEVRRRMMTRMTMRAASPVHDNIYHIFNHIHSRIISYHIIQLWIRSKIKKNTTKTCSLRTKSFFEYEILVILVIFFFLLIFHDFDGYFATRIRGPEIKRVRIRNFW